MSLGVVEILIVFLVFLVLGPKRLVNLLRSLGRGTHDFFEALGRSKGSELSEDRRESEDEPGR